jgi:O-antigen ligase
MSYLGFDARLVYAQAAFNTYLAYPVLGVGLGNYAFYFEDMLPYRPIAEVPEVLLMITPEPGRDRLITAKNLYLRLLAETGIVGAVTFLAFVIANFGCALYLWLSRQKEWEYWGAASLCGLLAFSLSALTFDSFVIPNMWVLFGLITAATSVKLKYSQAAEINP